MIKINKIIYLILLLFFSSNLTAKIENKIIVKVENEIITNYEIKNKILSTLILSNLEINQKNIDDLKRQSLNLLVNQKLKEIELKKYNIITTDLEINNYLNRISSNNVNSLKEKFISNNLDFSFLLNEIKTELNWKKLIFQLYNKRIDLEERLIDEEVEQILKSQNYIDEYMLSEIELQISEKDSIEKLFSEIKQSINIDGFDLTVKKFSTAESKVRSGSLGWIKSNVLSDEIYSKIKNLKPGEITNPIIRGNSFLILRVENIRKFELQNVDKKKLKENLISNKKNELFDLYSNSLLSQLKNNNIVEFK